MFNFNNFDLTNYYGPTLRILIIIIVTWIVYLIIKSFIKKVLKIAILKGLSRRVTDARVEKRVETITGVIAKTVLVILFFAASLMILAELGLNITPILTGAGVVGLAIGFGSQNLIKDILNGFFILAEDYFAQGDVIRIGDKEGEVVDVNLQRTVLRDYNGYEHIIPNREINIATNLTKRWARINLDISIDYQTNLEKVNKVIGEMAKELANDKKYGEKILEPPKVLGIQDLNGSSITIRIMMKAKAIDQWELTRELRRRVKITFDKAKIKIN